jgi:hypothetical protein
MAKLFHAGYGKWEVRQKRGDRTFGIGYFYTKKEAMKLLKRVK